MPMSLRVEPADNCPAIAYRWDRETDILAGRIEPAPQGRGYTGSVEFEGADGAFVLMEVEQGTVCGVEVVVWPPVEKVPALVPPLDAPMGRVTVPARPSQPGVGAVELDASLSAMVTEDERTIHLEVGGDDGDHEIRPVRVADRLVIELDEDDAIAGFWLLDVPVLEDES